MKICIKRGAHQIGGSCVEIAADNGKKIVIDIGMPLSEDFIEPSSVFLPEIEYDGLEALFISHPHGDHYMLAGFLEKKIPVYIGRAAAAIINAANSYGRNKVELRDTQPVENEIQFTIAGTFRVTPYLTDHSAYDSYMFMIEADGKRVLYTGDFRNHGRKAFRVNNMMAHPPKNIDVMLIEGTNVYPPETETAETDAAQKPDKSFISEEDLEKKFQKEFEQAKGIAAVWSSCQNIDRLVTIFKAAKAAKRKLVLPWQIGYIVKKIGNGKLPGFNYYPDVYKYKTNPEKRHEINTEQLAKNPEKYVVFLTSRITGDLLNAGLFNSDAVFIWSLWNGYKRQEHTAQTLNAIAATGAKIADDLHVSGHASLTTLVEFVDKLNPSRLVPVHTEHPQSFKTLEWNSGFTGKVETHADGEWFEV